MTLEQGMALATVLVVDDEPAIREMLGLVLEMEGFHVVTAGDGVDALHVVANQPPAVVVTDLMMPNLDGFTFMSTLAEHDPERLRKVIVTSAASPAVIRERMEGSPFHMLPKPFDISELLDRVRTCIDAQQ